MANDWQNTIARPWMGLSNAGVVVGYEATTIDYSMDTISARAQMRFAGNQQTGWPTFPAIDINQQVSIVGGYRSPGGGQSLSSLFAGFIEEDNSAFGRSKLANVISLGDQLRLTQYNLGDPFYDDRLLGGGIVANYDGTRLPTYDPLTGASTGSGPSPTNNAPGGGWTDTSIVSDLLSRSGVTNLSGIKGAGIIMGNLIPITLSNKLAPASLIAQVDQVSGCKTFSTPTGPQRIVTTFTPTAGAAWTLRQGFEILEIDNVRSLKQFYNRVLVRGLKLGGSVIISIRTASTNLPSVYGGGTKLPYGRANSQPITKVFDSDMIQSQNIADALSLSLLIMGNRIERKVRIKTRFNPDAIPGQSVAVLAPMAKIFSTINGYALGISHSLDASGAFTTWTIALYDTGGG